MRPPPPPIARGGVHIRSLSFLIPPKNSTPSEGGKSTEGSSAKREVHSTARSDAEVSIQSVAEDPSSKVNGKVIFETSGMAKRFVVTAEVTVSKIFPAGFGWQSSSILAENHLGFGADTASFALTTGLGDGVGVLLGHTAYYAAKRAGGFDPMINMKREFHTGILLSSAAFCSGTAWQPLVDALQGANLPFGAVFMGTWAGCGTAFYLGLRAARTILSGPLEHVHGPTYENSKTDTSLSVAIGGATGFFVGTDAAYMPDQNILIDVVGISDGTPDLTGCAIAGSSTAMGFAAAQTGMNAVFPAGKSWND